MKLLPFALTGLLLQGCGGEAPARSPETSAIDERAAREVVDRFDQAMVARNLDQAMAFLTPDVEIVYPDGKRQNAAQLRETLGALNEFKSYTRTRTDVTVALNGGNAVLQSTVTEKVVTDGYVTPPGKGVSKETVTVVSRDGKALIARIVATE